MAALIPRSDSEFDAFQANAYAVNGQRDGGGVSARLPAPGSFAWFKVYVVTTLGNEKGSNAVKVVRV